MPGALGFAIVLLGMAALVLTNGARPIAGLDPPEFAALVSFAALGLVIAAGVAHEFRGRWSDGVRSLALWGVIILGFVGLYGYRSELQEVGGRIVSELAPDRPVVTQGGEVQISRRLDGSFVVAATVNGRDARFIFDTGASTVVLTAESAASFGITPAPADYSVPVLTANGRSLTAAVVLDRLTVGSITERRVRALVARPGVLHENLLGMTFLERLASYEVRSNRLIFRPRSSGA